MAWVGELLAWAGPAAGWVISGLLGLTLLWFYATDRLVSKGRHIEQASHYERVMAKQDEHHRQTMDDLRRHFQELLDVAHHRAASFKEDRDYWREVGLDLMNAVSATVGRQDENS